MSHHRSSQLASIPLLLLILSFPLASFIDTAGATLGSCRDVSPPNIERAVSDLGVKVSTATDTNSFSRFPPSSGSFTPDFRIFFIDPVLSFLLKSPPAREYLTYFTYVNNMRDLSLEYALLISNKTVVNDGSNSYRNLFLAFLDTIYAALEKSIAGSVKIVVSESSWPTSGGTAASVDNARTYVNNFIQIVKTGSPRRPERAIETYIVRF